MVDIHSHIVFGVDDGAAEIEQSLAMLRAAAEDGTTDIVATPHCNARYAYDADVVDRKIGELSAACQGRPKIHRGSEFHLSIDNLDALLEHPTTYTINGGRYLLLECPDFHIGKHTESVLDRLFDGGIVPIIAHPERNPVLQRDPDRLEGWVELGCLAQLTSLSITGAFGSPPKTSAIRFLERGLAHVVASDSHDPERRHPRLSASYHAVEKLFGEETAEALFRENPRSVIEGLPLAGGKLPTKRRGRWWQF